VVSRALIARLFEHFRALDLQVDELEREINAWHREDTASQRLQGIPGIGPITASALVAIVGAILDRPGDPIDAKRAPNVVISARS